MNYAYREITTSTTATANDKIIGADTSDGVITITLPTAASVRSGFVLTIKDIGNNASTNNITIARAGSDQIDGLSPIVINISYGSVSLISGGASQWHII